MQPNDANVTETPPETTAANEHWMRQIRLSSLLILATAAPLWIFLAGALFPRHKNGEQGAFSLFVVVVLLGISAAIHRLLRPIPDAWAWCALAAPVLVIASLRAVALLSQWADG